MIDEQRTDHNGNTPLSNGTGHGRRGMNSCVEPIGSGSNPTDHRYLADISRYQWLLNSCSGGFNTQLLPSSEHTPNFECKIGGQRVDTTPPVPVFPERVTTDRTDDTPSAK